MFAPLRWSSFLPLLLCSAAMAETKEKTALWVLQPPVRPAVPAELRQLPNPIDAFIAAGYKAKGLTPVARADKRTLLRRVYLDLIGIPPAPAEQDAFLRDSSPDAYEKVVDQLLANAQHGVRYARHWLDVLRYADVDEAMPAEPGIYLWRDWVINALNEDLPYDQFVRAQLTGYRPTTRIKVSALGTRYRLEPRPEDMYALGFLARGHISGDPANPKELSLAAAETVSSAFMGLTAGCAKCHDHMYDPIKQRDFYRMKALFDPLVLKKVVLGTPAEIFAHGRALDEIEKRRAALEASMGSLIDPYKRRLYEGRVALLPPEVRAVVQKPEKERTVNEQRIADDYFPVLRIDPPKIKEIMPAAERQRYQELQDRLNQVEQEALRAAYPVFWTVEVDPRKELEKSYVLTSGDPDRPEKNHEVTPGWPFAPAGIDFSEGRIKAFADWLTAPENPVFARVAVNRLWLWHFGEGLHKTPNDFGNLGGEPEHPQLLDWLATEFVRRNFSMKQMHRLIVTSETYKLASSFSAAAAKANKVDTNNAYLWHFRLQRLEAEPIWDSLFSAAQALDLSVGGPSFDIDARREKNGGRRRAVLPAETPMKRRAAYMVRGYSSQRAIVPHFLQVFDVDDGRVPCPLRTQTVTAPQALFMMNSDAIDKACAQLAERLNKESRGDLTQAVDLGYRITLARPPSPNETAYALAYLGEDPGRLKSFAWLLFNLDEFIYAR
jgi:Protein of unknown function (DUF1553)/Protein of unknown function (DUF1549)